MRYTLTAPSCPKAVISLPASKSISNRALILHALSGGGSTLAHLSDCDDTAVMIRALSNQDEEVDILAAGTAMRFLTAYFSVTTGCRLLTGSERMQQRPIQLLVDALRELGADIRYAGCAGFPPLLINGGQLKGSRLTLAGNVSSQYISALLMIGPLLANGLQLQLTGRVISRPYIDLTLHLMELFGASATWLTGQCIHVEAQPYRPVPFTVESDWSAASYWYQIAALAPHAEITLTGLSASSFQGDSRGAELFARLGVSTHFALSGEVELRQTGLRPVCFEEDFLDIPDLAQTFVVTCALLGIPFRITGLQSLKIKETDRITALQTEMGKLGYLLHTDASGSLLAWEGGRCSPDAFPVIATYDDHRMAMAFAPASLCFPQLMIDHPEVVTKSYPGYWEDLKRAGFGII